MDVNVDDLMNKIVAPLAVALIAWVLKDVVVGLQRSRQEEARKEWLFRLREVYCPLFFWSAAVLFKGSASKDKFGVSELSAALAKAVTLLPAKQYFVFVKILEEATGQATSKASKADILKARDFVYSRIEALNFVLFKMPAHFNPQSQADPFASLRSGWRLTMTALVPLFIWLGFVLLLVGLYWSIAERPLVLMLVGVIVILLIVQEILQRQRQYESLKDRIST